MINEEEKEKFRKEKLPYYENYISDVVKAEENFVEVAKEKRLKKINKLKKQMGINIEEKVTLPFTIAIQKKRSRLNYMKQWLESEK